MCNDNFKLIEGLKHISKTHRSQFDERRKTEWKIVFTILAFYIGIIAAKITDKIEIEKNYLELIIAIWLFFLVIAIITILYLRRIHKANHTNKLIAKKAEDAIVAILQNNVPNLDILPNLDLKEWKKWKKWSWFWQFLMIISIALCSAIFLQFG